MFHCITAINGHFQQLKYIFRSDLAKIFYIGGVWKTE